MNIKAFRHVRPCLLLISCQLTTTRRQSYLWRSQPFKAWRCLYVQPGLTFKNSWCFVRISQQRATFALHAINWLVFNTVLESVYNAVLTASFYTEDYASSLKVETSYTMLWAPLVIICNLIAPIMTGTLTKYYRHQLLLLSGVQIFPILWNIIHSLSTSITFIFNIANKNDQQSTL